MYPNWLLFIFVSFLKHSFHSLWTVCVVLFFFLSVFYALKPIIVIKFIVMKTPLFLLRIGMYVCAAKERELFTFNMVRLLFILDPPYNQYNNVWFCCFYFNFWNVIVSDQLGLFSYMFLFFIFCCFCCHYCCYYGFIQFGFCLQCGLQFQVCGCFISWWVSCNSHEIRLFSNRIFCYGNCCYGNG